MAAHWPSGAMIKLSIQKCLGVIGQYNLLDLDSQLYRTHNRQLGMLGPLRTQDLHHLLPQLTV